MAKKFSLFLVCLLFGLIVVSSSTNSKNNSRRKIWCTVKVSSPPEKLQGFIDYACGRYNCKEIQPNGACYEPNNVQNHASYALHLVHKATDWCNPEIGWRTVTDPSYGNCHYI